MGGLVEQVLERLVAASVHAVALAAVVWVLCRLLKRLPPAAQCWLWWLVALQAVVGLCMDPLQLPWLPAMPIANTELAASQSMAVPHDAASWQLPVSSGPGIWSHTLLLGWMGGVFVLCGFTLRRWQRMRAMLKHAAPCEDSRLLEALAAAAASSGLRRAPALRLSQGIDSPMLVGHLHPVLLLPSRMALTADELDMAIAHELKHLKRGDLWWGCVPALARHLFFFHPFVHLAVREYGIAREVDCDASVVAAERHSRHDYGNLLLRLGTRPAADAELAVASPTFHALGRRLTMLQKVRFSSRIGSMALVLVVAAAGVLPLRLVAAAASPPAAAAAAVPAATPAAPAAPRRVEPVAAPATPAAEKATPPATATAAAAAPAAPQAPAQRAPQPVYTGERMTVSFEGVPVTAVLKAIADTSRRNIIVHDSVQGTVTVRLESVPWDQVLDIVLTAKGLEKRVQGDVIWVFPAGMQAPRQPAVAPSRSSGWEVSAATIRGNPDGAAFSAEGGFTMTIPQDEVLVLSAKNAAGEIAPGGPGAVDLHVQLKSGEFTAKAARYTMPEPGLFEFRGESLAFARKQTAVQIAERELADMSIAFNERHPLVQQQIRKVEELKREGMLKPD